MSQVTKLLLKIVMDRMKVNIEAELDDAQSGFRQRKGTGEGLLNLRLICEKHMEVHKYVYICFLDYEKAFDRVRHESLMQCLSENGVDGKDIKIIRNLYWDQTASVIIMNELSEEIRIQRGVRQGISHSLQFIHGKYVQTYYQYERCQRGRPKLQQSQIC